MFRITSGRGFQMTFPNGWTVSVQFGSDAYCSHHSRMLEGISNRKLGRELAEQGSVDAEIAAWDKNDRWYDFGDDTVKGYVSVTETLEFINMIAEKPTEVTLGAKNDIDDELSFCPRCNEPMQGRYCGNCERYTRC